MTTFQEQVLNAPDVCSSCFRLIRRERSQTASRTLRSDVSAEKSAYTRVQQTTDIDHTPDRTPTDCTVVWCECGSESAFDRWWDDGDDRCMTMPRFRELLKSCYYSLEAKGVTLDRDSCIRMAIATYREEHDVNAALEAGVKTGIHVAASSGSSERTARVVAD